MSNETEHEQLLVTRLYAVQKRLRWVRGVGAGLRWFAAGSVIASVILLILWNWNYVPGPWQWLASAGRPREVLWLPLLTALGGFASLWLIMPNPRQAAFKLDKELDSSERLLTSVDWILSEKPRTETSQRVLAQAAGLVKDESGFRKVVNNLEKTPNSTRALLLSIILPALMLHYLPARATLPESTALWLGESQVDQLTEELLKELEDTGDLEDPQEKLEELLKKLGETGESPQPSEERKAAQRELQRLVDQMVQQAESKEKARQLLETLAERARQQQPMTDKDRQALEALRQKVADQKQSEKLEQASQQWEDGEFDQASQSMESVQQQMGESSESLSQGAREASTEGKLEADSGQEFDENQGDQFDAQGRAKGQGGEGEGQGEGMGMGQGQGEGEGQGGEGDGQGEGAGIGVGKGTTLEEQEGGTRTGRSRQSLRRSDEESEWLEEYEHLHPPERTEFQKAQTRVRGEMGDGGPRYRTSKEGYGQATEAGQIDGSGGILQYREEAESAILREEVPADCRDNVRVYFESLDRR